MPRPRRLRALLLPSPPPPHPGEDWGSTGSHLLRLGKGQAAGRPVCPPAAVAAADADGPGRRRGGRSQWAPGVWRRPGGSTQPVAAARVPAGGRSQSGGVGTRRRGAAALRMPAMIHSPLCGGRGKRRSCVRRRLAHVVAVLCCFRSAAAVCRRELPLGRWAWLAAWRGAAWRGRRVCGRLRQAAAAGLSPKPSWPGGKQGAGDGAQMGLRGWGMPAMSREPGSRR